MGFFRLLGYLLVYGSIAVLIYWGMTDDPKGLWTAIAMIVTGSILLMFTYDNRRRRSSNHGSWLDAWDAIELIEIPFRLLGWLFSKIWHIFD